MTQYDLVCIILHCFFVYTMQFHTFNHSSTSRPISNMGAQNVANLANVMQNMVSFKISLNFSS